MKKQIEQRPSNEGISASTQSGKLHKKHAKDNENDKKGYPVPSQKDNQLKNQPEFIDSREIGRNS